MDIKDVMAGMRLRLKHEPKMTGTVISVGSAFMEFLPDKPKVGDYDPEPWEQIPQTELFDPRASGAPQ